MEGTRDVEISVSTRQVDVTGWDHKYQSSLPVAVDASLTARLYYSDETSSIWNNLQDHPKAPLTCAVSGVFSGTFVVSDVRASVPINGVIAHDVTFKLWNWQ